MPTKILAIDDSKTIRLAIKITFAAEDAEVVAVSRGSEALARAKQMHADVVLVDHSLATGEPSGFDVCKGLKADPETANTPIVLMIPAHGGVGQTEVQACGADASLRKPFETQELIDTVARVVGQAVTRQAEPMAAARPAPVREVARAPATAPPAERPAAAVARQPAATRQPAVAPRTGAVGATPSPAVQPRAAAPTPASRRPSAVSPEPARPIASPAQPVAPGSIPVAIPIPFTAADSPTTGMLERLRAAAAQGGVGTGLDAKAVEALLALTHEVIEQVVWEVVPELAEEIIRQQAAVRPNAQPGAE